MRKYILPLLLSVVMCGPFPVTDGRESDQPHTHEHTCCSLASGFYECGTYANGSKMRCCSICNSTCLIFDDDSKNQSVPMPTPDPPPVPVPPVCEDHCKGKEACWWDGNAKCCPKCKQACPVWG